MYSPMIYDEKEYLYRTVDAGLGVVLVEHVEKRGNFNGIYYSIKEVIQKIWKTKIILSWIKERVFEMTKKTKVKYL